MQLHVASLDLKLAFDRPTTKLLYDAMVDSVTHPTLSMALLREQVGGRNMAWDHGRRSELRQVHQARRERQSYLVQHGDALLAGRQSVALPPVRGLPHPD